MNFDLRLSTSNVESLATQLRKLARELPNKTKKCNKDLADYGKIELSKNIMEISNLDGNDDIGTITANEDELIWSGSQIAYLEFGTGPTGTDNPYPVDLPVSWERCTYEWNYVKNGQVFHSVGIPAYAPMLHAGESMREQEKTIYNGILSK